MLPPNKSIINSMIQEIFSVYHFISRSSSASKSTIFTHYINMSQKDIQKLKSLASWQEAFFPCCCRKRHHIYREWWMEQLLMSGFITFLRHVAPSTASTISLYCRRSFSYCCMNTVPPPSFLLFSSLPLPILRSPPPLPSLTLSLSPFLLSRRSCVPLSLFLFFSLPHSFTVYIRLSSLSFTRSLSHSELTAHRALSCRSTSLQSIPWMKMNVIVLNHRYQFKHSQKIHTYIHDTLSGYSIVITVHWF